MASTSTSFSRERYGYARVTNLSSNEEHSYPLYELGSIPASIEIASEGPVVENQRYALSILLPRNNDISEIEISVNGNDSIHTRVGGLSTALIGSQEYSVYDIPLIKDQDLLFLLTFGFARIEVFFTARGSHEETMLTTKDIPCLSNADYQAPLVEGMLSELLDSERDTVARWMFAGRDNNQANYSITDTTPRENAMKSLSSFIQLLDFAATEYEKHFDYFRSHGYSKISSVQRKLQPRSLRRTGSQELLWLAKNANVLSESLQETSIDYLGRYYLPREVQTAVRTKSYNSYENQLLLGFIDELLTGAKRIGLSLKKSVESAKELEKQLSPITNEEYTLPALMLVQQCTSRENHYIAALQKIVDRFQKIRRRYHMALPGVEAKFARPPKRTKVFQEVRAYAEVFDVILKWLEFDDFTLDRENLALHSLRLDKLYEYYTLFKILEWFHGKGFGEDEILDSPILQAEYSLKYKYYKKETRVATLYNLRSKNLRIRLYYQPIIYGSPIEEHGITLHRLSSRYATSKAGLDSYWTPDFLLAITDEAGLTTWHIIDAKYRKAEKLWEGYPEDGPFATSTLKYRMDIKGLGPGDTISSLWLLCGREQGQHLQTAELSTWARQFFDEYHSGTGALTPVYNCLNDILPHMLGGDIGQQLEGLHGAATESTSSKNLNTAEEKSRLGTRLGTAISTGVVEGPANEWMTLVTELYDLVEDEEALFKSSWAQSRLGLAHPLLRKSAPQGRERKYYERTEISGQPCFAYSFWLPNYENRLRALVERQRASSERR